MLIAFSGIDGGGKTTQVEILRQVLIDSGYEVVVTKAYNEEMKEKFKYYVENWADEARMFLFQAFHARQFDETCDALKKGAIVLADRWDESFIAYHSNFGPLADKSDFRLKLNTEAFHGLLPDVGFFFDVPVEIARQRRESRGKIEKIEDRPDYWYEIIQNGYRIVALNRAWHILDGTSDVHDLHNQILVKPLPPLNL